MKMKDEIVSLVKELIKNDDGNYHQELESFLNGFITNTEAMESCEIFNVFKYITNDGFNMIGFQLYEIPHPNVYIFYNRDKKQMFDINTGCFCPNNISVSAAYARKCISGHGYDILPALSIKEAVQKYDKDLAFDA